MIADILAEVLVRQVPGHLQAGLADGSCRIFGSIIKDVATGRVLGHLQEAAPLAKLVGDALNPMGIALGPALDVAGLVQGEVVRQGVAQLQRGVATLTTIGLGNLAFSAAGIGVSVVGFAVVSAKIERLRRSVSAMGDRLEQIGDRIDQLSRDIVDIDFVEIQALAKSHDEAWWLSASAAETRWHDVARAALSYQSRFEMRADRILQQGMDRYLLADPFLDAASMASGLRVASLAACNEVAAAQAAAADGARGIERLTGGIGLADLGRVERAKLRASPGSTQWAVAQARASQAVGPIIQKIRQREAAAATRAAPLARLGDWGMSSREWLERARSEKEDAFLYLPEIAS